MSRTRWIWLVCLIGVWLLRLPSLAQPMGSDQGLYAYAGQRLLAGDAPYAGAWDQKPPGIHVVYAALWSVWPHQSVVAGADMAAAALVAWLLIVLGRRRFTEAAGATAAAVFLVFGNPALTQRLGGVFVRAQCETFIALAITAALVLMAHPRRTTGRLVGVGVLLGLAFWLKPNAATYGITILAALACWRPTAAETTTTGAQVRHFLSAVVPIVVAGGATIIIPLLVIAARGALTDLYLATVAYNAVYSGSTYDGIGSLIRYAASFPIDRARNDALWFMGGVGVILLLLRQIRGPHGLTRSHIVMPLAWLVGAWLSILINGGRNLPQYFVQANPALALAAGVGLTEAFRVLRRRHLLVSAVGAAVLLYGAHRVSAFDELARNTTRDWAALTGATPRDEYLTSFGNRPQDKFVASAIAGLTTLVTTTTAQTDTIYLFGFSPGVYVLSDRRSASRFHWSQPIILEFAADRPGYGTSGLLRDLERNAPSLVALQRDSWGPNGQHSSDFFHATPALDAWLTAGYWRDADIDRFEIWRRR